LWVALHGKEAADLGILLEENIKGGSTGCVGWGPRRGKERSGIRHCRLCWIDQKGALEFLDLGGKICERINFWSRRKFKSLANEIGINSRIT
jgi:hypothetical protein